MSFKAGNLEHLENFGIPLIILEICTLQTLRLYTSDHLYWPIFDHILENTIDPAT